MEKTEARRKGIQARHDIKEDIRKQKEEIINTKMISYMHDHHCVAMYIPITDEVNILPALHWAIDHGKHVCLPVITDGRMCFSPVSDIDALQQGMYNIPEPAYDPIPLSDIDTVFVPLTSYDSDHNRTGYGKGYYDSVLCHMRSRTGIAFVEQKVDHIETESHDIALDDVICA